MARTVRLAAAQMGTTNKWDDRAATLTRMINLLRDAARQGAQIVLFPEIALTTFFPRYLILDEAEVESWFEHGDIRTAPNTKALFDVAAEVGVDIVIGFAEATETGDHYNSCVYFHAKSGDILARYRKVHLPGDVNPLPDPKAVNQLEKRYFLPGNLGFKAFRVPGLVEVDEKPNKEGRVVRDPIVGMMICNDRRWAESWRAYGLQGVEIVLCGYNTNGFAPQFWGQSTDMTKEECEAFSLFHHKLVMQAHSYTNATFSVSSARCGLDDGEYPLISGSTIVDPEGRIIAESKTVEDEVIIADCDLDLCRPGKTRAFDFDRHRRIEHYGILAQQTGVIEPPLLNQAASASTSATEPESAPTLTIPAIATPSPSTKKYRILLINPNATHSMTEKCIAMLQPTLPPDVTVTGFTSPAPAPTAIEGSLDAVLSTAAAVRAVLPIAEQYDAFLVACYSDHPLTKALREELSQPVVGIMEASLFAARTLGGRFGIVVTSSRSAVLHTDSIRNYGLEGFSVGVASCGLGVLGLERKGEDVVLGAMCDAAKDLVARGADVITLGCAGMSRLKEAVEGAVGGDVQVIDGVLAGVQHLSGILRMGGRTAKRGVYTSSRVTREGRGQDYL
ncbi:carbon-nitrogen hydrolase [Aspergillus stella-maris]|uniref:carbon-nitrogen hydrolase n=1 Tax=Aspergillus stella-maris TaxID=1810926 RepID=UPI003CCD01B5